MNPAAKILPTNLIAVQVQTFSIASTSIRPCKSTCIHASWATGFDRQSVAISYPFLLAV
jgi:hypothetical protein